MKTPTKYRCVGCRPVSGQSRFVAQKRTALDGRKWWCVFDNKRRAYIPGTRCKLRRELEWCIQKGLRQGWLQFEPDSPGHEEEKD